MEFVVLENNETIKPKFQTAQPPELLEETDKYLLYKLKNGLKLRFYTGKGTWMNRLFYNIVSQKIFSMLFKKHFPSVKYSGKEIGDECSIYPCKNSNTFLPS